MVSLHEGDEKSPGTVCCSSEPFAIWFGLVITYFQRYLERSGGDENSLGTVCCSSEPLYRRST